MLHPTHPHPTSSHLAPAHPPSYPLPVRVVQLYGIGHDGTPDGSPDGKAALNKSVKPLGKAEEGLGKTVMPPHCIFSNLPAARGRKQCLPSSHARVHAAVAARVHAAAAVASSTTAAFQALLLTFSSNSHLSAA